MSAKHYTAVINDYGYTELIADEGWWLYNGVVCTRHAYLGKFDSEENWQAVDHYIEPDTPDDEEQEEVDTDV